MSKKLPYMSAPNALTKILNKVKEAAVPSVFNPDFYLRYWALKGGTIEHSFPGQKNAEY